jgi:Hemerythrin HHE cation binding domain
MDVTKLLEADHRQAEGLFSKIARAEGDARRPLIDQLATALRAHMSLEEEVLYPAMGQVTGRNSVDEAKAEHELGRKGLEDMVRLGPDAPGFGAALDAAKAGIQHHVKEEEGEIFPQLRREEKVLAEVATPFMHKRMELGLPMGADALAKASTKQELLAEAKSAGIEGASSMSKEELAGALAAKMA